MADLDRRLFPARTVLPIQWGDMDAYQHVNNIRYFRFFESCRITYFDELGLTDSIQSRGIGPILAETSCRYRRPVTYPDTVEVLGRITWMAETEFEMEYVLWSEKLNDAAAVGFARVVFFDYKEAKRIAIPDEYRRAIRKFDAGVKEVHAPPQQASMK